MFSKLKDGLIIAKLEPNQELFEGLKQIASEHKVQTAAIVSGIGMLKDFEIGYFLGKGNYSRKTFKEPYELVSLQGTIALQPDKNYLVHLHVCLAGKNHEIIGGHLFGGKIEVAGEIVLQLSRIKLERKEDEKTGLKLICGLE